ncbi:MAG: HAD family phosphatase [Verrucomicrobiota bacterium]|nr:HAD family phosphatase [Verrucomicrobiota bacterium]
MKVIYIWIFCLLSSMIFAQPTAVIFDCDGVLVDSGMLHYRAWKEVLKKRGIELSVGEYTPMFGKVSEEMISYLKELKGVELCPCVIEEKRKSFEFFFQEASELFIEEMCEWAKKIKGQGYKTALASAGAHSQIQQYLQSAGLQGVFDVVLSGKDDLGEYKDPEGVNKPKPYIYLKAAKLLSVEPSDCLVFEDSWAGVLAGKEAGMYVVAVPYPFTSSQGAQVLADYVLDDLHTESLRQAMESFQ